MTYSEILKNNIIDNLSHDWYLKKRVSYESHKNYNELKDLIEVEVKQAINEYDESGNIINSEDDSYLKVTRFEHYCWNEPANEIIRSELGSINKKTPKNVIDLIDDFVFDFNKYELVVGQTEINYNRIQKTIIKVQDAFAILKSKSDDDKYVSTLDLICFRTIDYLQNRFEHIYEAMQEGVDNTDTLDFYLNKSQISALIALLIESEMVEPLRKKSKVNIAKYNFFTSYFRAIDPETNQKLTLTTLQDDLSKFDKGKRLSSLNAIFKSIELAYERLISGDA